MPHAVIPPLVRRIAAGMTVAWLTGCASPSGVLNDIASEGKVEAPTSSAGSATPNASETTAGKPPAIPVSEATASAEALKAWTGPNAVVRDTVVREDNNRGHYFVMTKLGNVSIHNALREKQTTSWMGHRYPTFKETRRRVPAGATSVVIAASNQSPSAAPIEQLFNSARGRDHGVWGVVPFAPEPDREYVVNGFLAGAYSQVWIEDAKTGQKVTPVVSQGTPNTPVTSAGDRIRHAFGYTCCNLRSVNQYVSDRYSLADSFIPAGTPVRFLSYGRHSAMVSIAGEPVTIGHDYGRGHESLESFVYKLILPADPKQLIAQSARSVQQAIAIGRVQPGMSRPEVLLALGYPGSAETRNLTDPTWRYYVNTGKEETLTVEFDENGLVSRVTGSPAALSRVMVPDLPGQQGPTVPTRREVMARDTDLQNAGRQP